MVTTEAPEQELVLSEEEQDSLRVGEELERARLGEKEEKISAEIEPEEEPEEESEEVEDYSDVDIDEVLAKLWDEYNGDEEDYSDEILEELGKLDQADLAIKYAQLREEMSEEKEFTEEDVSTIKEMVGGDKNYTEMVTWASESMTEDEVNLYNVAMSKGDPVTAYFAVQALALRYGDAVGTEGNRVSGRTRASSGPGDVYRSRAEVVQAMSDPRYDNDPAYRSDVFKKLERSQVEM